MPGATTSRVRTMAEIMSRHAERTGVGSETGSRRYLWTDAFAVCNLLTLAETTGSDAWRDQALALIDDVHHTLGRHRPDDLRSGWISGLSEAEGEQHPTRGGLRIGKPLSERAFDADFEPELEWEQDGQYLHYLTRWMHALHQAARVCERPQLLEWARELAATAFRAFRFETPSGRHGLYWKMSIDLSRPLVPSMGQHDPLDAYLTGLELTGLELTGFELAGPTLEDEIAWLARLVEGGRWATDDPLGLGGLMMDADRAFQIEARGDKRVAGLALDLIGAARDGLDLLIERAPWQAPAIYRLPFRELGLAIGFEALAALHERLGTDDAEDIEDQSMLAEGLGSLLRERPLAEALVAFWLDPQSRQQTANWAAHEDINEVMLATALAPSGYLDLGLDRERHSGPATALPGQD